jgi:hypothetical protein
MRKTILDDVSKSLQGTASSTSRHEWIGAATDLLQHVLGSLPGILTFCLENETALHRMADDSYLHINGFYKMLLASSGGVRLRLHVWGSNINFEHSEGENDPHDHRWSFVSSPVIGKVTETRFREVECSRAPNSTYLIYHCRPRQFGKVRVAKVGKIGLQSAGSSTRAPGDIYSCDADQIHLIRPTTTGLSATLVVTGPPTRTFARVYSRGKGIPVDAAIATPSLTIGEARGVLQTVRGALRENLVES